MVNWIDVVEPGVNRNKLKRPTKHSWYSLFRKFGHKTKGGKGIIQRLRKKRRK